MLRGIRKFFSFIWRNKVKSLVVVVLIAAIAGVGGYQGSMKLFHDYPQLCELCHIIKPYYTSWSRSDFLDYRHTLKGRTVKESTVEGFTDKDVVCKDCHYAPPQRLFEELWNYATGNYHNPLEERRFATAECFACHKDYNHLITLTANLEKKYPNLPQPGWNPHSSHFGEINCRVCHRVHRPSVDFCSTCHGQTMTGPGWTQEVEWKQQP